LIGHGDGGIIVVMPASSQPSYEEVVAENAALREADIVRDALIARLEARIVELEARLNQNSKNSSRLPSSDPVPAENSSVQVRDGVVAQCDLCVYQWHDVRLCCCAWRT
jgi:hypothetical protein